MPAETDLLARGESPAPDREREQSWALGRPPLPLWIGLCAFCVAVVSWAVHTMFLFADDFIFLNQARDQPYNLHYLRLGLFQHFSPVTRVVNKLLVQVLPHWRAAPFAGLIVMDLLVVVGAALLMIALFGRTWLAWIGTLLLGTSLSLVPTMHWWTAGLNILPAMAGVTAGFGAMVLFLRGRSAWWAGLALLAYLVAITDYELGMLMPCYLGLWLLLFGSRAIGKPLVAVLRRSWWAWSLLFIMLLLSMYNYRVNYYKPAPKAGLHLIVDGLFVSLFHTLLPSLVGLHGDAYTPGWDRFAVVVGVVLLLGLFGWTMARSLSAWRGWAFAGAGWLVPALALLVNRLGYTHSTSVATSLIYEYLAVAMFLVGVLEAVLQAGLLTRFSAVRRPPVRTVRVGLAGFTVLCVLAGIGWVHSLTPTLRVQNVAGPARDYVSNVEHGAAAAAKGGPYGILSSTVPPRLISHTFVPFNATTRVVGLYDRNLPFDVPAARLFALDAAGHLYPVSLHSLLRAEPSGTEATMTAHNVTDLHTDPQQGMCFRTKVDARVVVTLPTPLTGQHLVARTNFTVGAPTAERVYVLAPNAKAWTAGNGDPRLWQPGQTALLDTVSATSILGLQILRFTPNVPVCISSIEVSDAVPTGK